ncbi:MAG TPA: succinylglutamate desuccinylase/aspartoacylase family protein [Dehalococcoidia bacterium]|nr:succinylglutamate desuccinylase/aspartoacylase family protein [Dehalococcoidia bacterium]
MQQHSRRQALRLLGGGALGALLAACGSDGEIVAPVATPEPAPPTISAVAAIPSPPDPVPRPVPPKARIERTLMAGSEWETPLTVTHSGVDGPRVMLLGGVHGNESGGWQAAEQIATWEPLAGSLLVVPRANRLSTYEFERTLSGFGDLNRLYPGYAESPLPMARMAAEITFAAQRFEVDLLRDLHESWCFFSDHDERGTAFLGQTVTKGDGPFELANVAAIVDGVNEQASTREQLLLRDRHSLGGGSSFGLGFGGGGSSSLSLGRHVPGLTPVLIEMGQQNQPEWRRAELHQLFVRSTLERWAML